MNKPLNSIQENTASHFRPEHRDLILKAYSAPVLDRARIIFAAGHVHGRTRAVNYITSCIGTLDRQT